MIPLDQALDRLIHKRGYRDAYLQGRFDALELAASDLALVRSMNGQALGRLAERVAGEALARKHSGSGSLFELYPRSIQAWREAHPEDASGLCLAFAFLDSPAFDGYRELPFSGIGTSLEEAFFRFCELEGLADRVIREHEFLAAMMQLLVVSPSACVALPDCIQRTAGGFFSISARAAPTLYAAVRGRLVRGPLTPFLASLLAPGAQPRQVAEQHGVSKSVLDQSLAQLSALGLVPRCS